MLNNTRRSCNAALLICTTSGQKLKFMHKVIRTKTIHTNIPKSTASLSFRNIPMHIVFLLLVRLPKRERFQNIGVFQYCVSTSKHKP